MLKSRIVARKRRAKRLLQENPLKDYVAFDSELADSNSSISFWTQGMWLKSPFRLIRKFIGDLDNSVVLKAIDFLRQ
jgi:hypothetical protein